MAFSAIFSSLSVDAIWQVEARRLDFLKQNRTHQFDQYTTGIPGPVVILIGGMHGNEPAGVRAIKQAFETLRAHQVPIRGTLYGFAGNRAALIRGCRFIDVDFNRVWDQPQAKLEGAPHERGEFQSLSHELEPLFAQGDVFLLDLHTTSSKGAPFLMVGRGEPYRHLFADLSLPVVSGLIDGLTGTLVRQVQERGLLGFAAEGGQHGHPDSLRNLVQIIWCILSKVGVLNQPEMFHLANQELAGQFGHYPGFLDLAYRHQIQPQSEFKMMPGYRNFMLVHPGEILAHDLRGPVPAPVPGHILMPLYQGQGEDGFFIAKEV